MEKDFTFEMMKKFWRRMVGMATKQRGHLTAPELQNENRLGR